MCFLPGDALKQQRRCRGGHIQKAVGAMDLSVARMDRGGKDGIRPQLFQQKAYGAHIRHRVQGSHLVKVDLGNGPAVDLCFRPGNALIDGFGLLLYGSGSPEVIQNPLDVRQGAVVVTVVSILFRSVDGDPHMCAGNAFSLLLFGVKPHPGDAQFIQPAQGFFRIFGEFQQGRREHIPRGAHG